MAPRILTSHRRFVVAIALLLLMPLQLAGAAAVRGGGACCGPGEALAAVARAFTSQSCHDAAGNPVEAPRELVTRAADCGAVATALPAPCGDCTAHCGVTAWGIVAAPDVAPLIATSADRIPFARTWSPTPAPHRLERPPSTTA
jgi:hypothetical protein